jgi:hypothetical protein
MRSFALEEHWMKHDSFSMGDDQLPRGETVIKYRHNGRLFASCPHGCEAFNFEEIDDDLAEMKCTTEFIAHLRTCPVKNKAQKEQ